MMKIMIIPSPLHHGDTIGIMSPSSFITEEDVNKAKAIVEGYGYKTYIHPQTLNRLNQSAGTNAEKRDAFHDLIKNPAVKAIIFSCGGNRALHWVDQIDYDLVKANPKIMMGFSDITALLNIITARTGLQTFHGPTLRWFMRNADNKTDIDQCFAVLGGTETEDCPLGTLNIDCPQMSVPKGQSLIGGNLSVFQYLLNDVDVTGKILFLEDWNVELSHLDRMFCHLKRQGVFDKIRGLILGQFDNLTDTGRPYGFTLNDIIAEHVPASLPLITNAPFGHGERLMTLRVG